MKSVVYTRTGGPEVLQLVDRQVPEVPPGHVRVRVVVSGVNPTDWRWRSGQSSALRFAEQVPHQDGAGVVDEVADDVTELRAGDRVWLWETAFGRPTGTAQEFVVIPARHAVPLPPNASFELGAALGIPALTAHRMLTVGPEAPNRLAPGALSGTSVLVHGGAGAVGNAAVQLAVWAGATVIATVSNARKEELARHAGAQHVVNYRQDNVAERVLSVAPEGVAIIAEVDLAANLSTDITAIATNGVISLCTYGSGELLPIPSAPLLAKSVSLCCVYTYHTPRQAKLNAIADVNQAVADGGFRVGDVHGLPLVHYPLHQVAEAHAAVEQGAVVGKVVIDVGAGE